MMLDAGGASGGGDADAETGQRKEDGREKRKINQKTCVGSLSRSRWLMFGEVGRGGGVAGSEPSGRFTQPGLARSAVTLCLIICRGRC